MQLYFPAGDAACTAGVALFNDKLNSGTIDALLAAAGFMLDDATKSKSFYEKLTIWAQGYGDASLEKAQANFEPFTPETNVEKAQYANTLTAFAAAGSSRFAVDNTIFRRLLAVEKIVEDQQTKMAVMEDLLADRRQRNTATNTDPQPGFGDKINAASDANTNDAGDANTNDVDDATTNDADANQTPPGGRTAGIVVAAVLLFVGCVAAFFWRRQRAQSAGQANMGRQRKAYNNNPTYATGYATDGSTARRCQRCGTKVAQCVCIERAASIAQGNFPRTATDEHIDVDGPGLAGNSHPAPADPQPWFVRGVGRGACKARVLAAAEQGSFLVRASQTTAGAYAFCINLGNGRVQEDLATPDAAGKLALHFGKGGAKGTPSFPDLHSLVEYCQTNMISPKAGTAFTLGSFAPALPAGGPHPDAADGSDAVYACTYGEVDAGLLAFHNRVVVATHEIYDSLAANPLAALDSAAPVPLADAIKAAEEHCGSLAADFADAQTFAIQNAAALARFNVSHDVVKAIFMYTKEGNLYKKMNAALGNYGDEADPRSKLPHYVPFAQWLRSSLALLPKVQQIVYRGVNLPHTVLLNGARAGDTITWLSFASTTLNPSVLRAKEFLNAVVSITDGKVVDVQNLDNMYSNVAPEEKTIFQIDVCRGVNIEPFSAVQGEDEVLLAAGSTFIITGINLWRHGITEVRLKQIDDAGGRTPASIDESAFNPIDVYMALDPEVDTNYGIYAGTGGTGETAVYSVSAELESTPAEGPCSSPAAAGIGGNTEV